jgi:hypothetical protein
MKVYFSENSSFVFLATYQKAIIKFGNLEKELQNLEYVTIFSRKFLLISQNHCWLVLILILGLVSG